MQDKDGNQLQVGDTVDVYSPYPNSTDWVAAIVVQDRPPFVGVNCPTRGWNNGGMHPKHVRKKDTDLDMDEGL